MTTLENDFNTILKGKVFSSFTAITVFEIASKKYKGSVENGIKCLGDASEALKK